MKWECVCGGVNRAQDFKRTDSELLLPEQGEGPMGNFLYRCWGSRRSMQDLSVASGPQVSLKARRLAGLQSQPLSEGPRWGRAGQCTVARAKGKHRARPKGPQIHEHCSRPSSPKAGRLRKGF